MGYYHVLRPIDQKLFPIGDKERRLAFARILRYTSIAYLQKIEEHFVVFANAYELFVKKKGFDEDRRFLLEGFYHHLGCFQDGLKELKAGNLTGYQLCRQGISVIGEVIYHRRIDDSNALKEIGMRYEPKKSFALYRLGEKMFDMMRKFGSTTFGGGAFNLQFPHSESEVSYLNGHLPPLPIPQSKPIPTQTVVPVSGIYMAIHEYGYPTYYCQGSWTKEATVPDELEETYQNYDDFRNKKPPIDTTAFTKSVPVEWVLLWKDDRYRDGRIPDESHFIDETCELPTYSLVPPPLTDDD